MSKEDVEEGKSEAIVTSRVTPMKQNTIAHKNLDTARKHLMMNSPAMSTRSML